MHYEHKELSTRYKGLKEVAMGNYHIMEKFRAKRYNRIVFVVAEGWNNIKVHGNGTGGTLHFFDFMKCKHTRPNETEMDKIMKDPRGAHIDMDIHLQTYLAQDKTAEYFLQSILTGHTPPLVQLNTELSYDPDSNYITEDSLVHQYGHVMHYVGDKEAFSWLKTSVSKQMTTDLYDWRNK